MPATPSNSHFFVFSPDIEALCVIGMRDDEVYRSSGNALGIVIPSIRPPCRECVEEDVGKTV